ncbi:MAG: HD domain-containing protein [Clostridia bacterium]|nr:HD domain-containing protein [Clostridia bacterium]
MKSIYISDLKVKDEIMDFFMIKSVLVKSGSNGRDYLDMVLGDTTGEVSSKKWNVSPQEANKFAVGDIVKVKGLVKEWNGTKQLDVNAIRLAVEEDDVDKSAFIKCAPIPTDEMYKYMVDTAEGFKDEDLKKLCLKVLEEKEEKLLYWPAASKNHHAEFGGLLYHMKRMLDNGKAMAKVYTMLDEDLLLAGVILHDMEKINEIDSDLNGMSSGYSFEGQLLGHIVQGVKSLEKNCDELGIDEEKKIMLEHMILSHHYEPEFGSPKRPLFPEAEILHYLDIIDARMYDMEEALRNVEPGEFSERIWTLDNRRIYRRK